jgi:hypothetical protein
LIVLLLLHCSVIINYVTGSAAPLPFVHATISGGNGTALCLYRHYRARILKHFMGAEKTTFAMKKYLSIHTRFFGILKHSSCLTRRVTTASSCYKMIDCLRIPLEKSTFPKAIFSAASLKCLRIRALVSYQDKPGYVEFAALFETVSVISIILNQLFLNCYS